MNALVVVIHIIGLFLIVTAAVLYYLGWKRLHKLWPTPFSRVRLIMFTGGLILLTLMLFPPVSFWAERYLSIRAVQKVQLSMLIPPVLWAGLPFHCTMFGLHTSIRNCITKHVIQASRVKRILRDATRPGLSWLYFITAFLLWHEPNYASWLLNHTWVNILFSATLLIVSLCFWSHIAGTSPRIHRQQPAWILLVILVAAEVPNMATGITVAFANEPIYAHYAAIRQSNALPQHQFLLTVVEDQRLSGCITWIAGSLIYVSAIILVFNRLFKQELGLPPLMSFTQGADERTIAPGLEHRVYQSRWQKIESNSETS